MINWFPLTLLLKSIPVQQARAYYQRLKGEYQNDPVGYANKRWEIVSYHYENNPWYKNRIVNKTEWNNLPVLTKKSFQGEDVLTPVYKTDHYASKTSGSSGTPLFYYKDKFAHALTWAEILDKYSQHGIIYGRSLQARFYAIPLEGVQYYVERLKDFLSGRYRFIIHDMADSKLEEFVDIFRRRPFEYLYGYTNSLVLFARYLIRQSVVLKEVCPTIRICVVTSEVCSPEDRVLLERAFGVKVINEYGASEAGLIAFEDKSMNWRISGELMYVEILDDNDHPLPDGEIGKIVVTCYFNKAMPFIRYEVGDRGSLWRDERGIVYLKQLYGRLNDVLTLRNGKIVPGFTLYYATKAMMEKLPGMREYNIRQTAMEEITFDLVLDREVEEDCRKEIENIVKQYLNDNFSVVFKRVDKIDRLSSGKMKHFHALQ
jgi:phenylacetate-CoA ligase